MHPVPGDAGRSGEDADEGDGPEASGGEQGREHTNTDRCAALHGEVVHGDGTSVLAGGDGRKDRVVDGRKQGAEARVDETHGCRDNPRPHAHAQRDEDGTREDEADARAHGPPAPDASHDGTRRHGGGQGDAVGGQQAHGHLRGGKPVVGGTNAVHEGRDREVHAVDDHDEADRARPRDVREEGARDEGGARTPDVAPEENAAEDEAGDEPPARVRSDQGEQQGQRGEDRETDEVDAPGAGTRGDSAPHDGQECEAGQGNEEEKRPVDLGENAAREHADRSAPLEGGAHEADVESSFLRVTDGGRQDHVRGGGGLVPQCLEGTSDDDTDQGRGEGKSEQGTGNDQRDPHVDDATQRNEISECPVQEAGDAEYDAGDRGDEAGGVTGTDVGGDSQVDQVEALEGDSAERVDAEEGQENARGVVHPGCAGCGGAHGRRGRGPFPDHLGRDGGDAAGWGCRACRNEVSEIAHGG